MAQNSDIKNYMPQIRIPAYLRISRILAYIMYAWVLFGIVVILLRVFLLAFSANLSAPFAQFIYRTSNDYLEPFRGIFPPKPIGETGYLDIAALFAIIVYLFVAWLFASLVHHVQNKIDQDIAAQKEGFKAKLAASIKRNGKK